MQQQPLHVLKFNYDATAPLVNITLSLCPAPPPPVEHPDGKSIPSLAEEEPKVIYSGTHQGGFNQIFNLPPESALDLSAAIAPVNMDSRLSMSESDKNFNPDAAHAAVEQGMADISLSGPTPTDLATVPEVPNATQTANGRRQAPRRLGGIFGRRQRETDVEAGAIELENRNEEEKNAAANLMPDKGMRLLIRLEGVGAEGAPLKRRNAQLTHILVSGMWSPENSSTVNAAGAMPKQIWVVKVVRREALVRHLLASRR